MRRPTDVVTMIVEVRRLLLKWTGKAHRPPSGEDQGGSCVAITREEFLKLGLVGGAGLVLSSGTSVSSPRRRSRAVTGNLLRSKVHLPEPFRLPLVVPPVLKPVRTDSRARATTDYYRITQEEEEA